ncbi:MAG: hypothetical protein ACO27L_06795, partial [Schleiferiaceae bacterium]
MKVRLLAVVALVAGQVFAQNNISTPARVLLQSGTYSLPESNAVQVRSMGSTNGRQVRVVAFNRPLTQLEWATWSAKGAVNHGYLPLNAYLIEFQREDAWLELGNLPMLGASPFTPLMKLSSQLAGGSFPDYAWSGADVELLVVPLATALREAVVGDLNRIGRVIGSSALGIQVVIKPADLGRVTKLADVQFVQPK